VNALGTLNLLEELRLLTSPPPLVFASSSRVYGILPNLEVEPNCTRYQPLNSPIEIGEDYPLSFYSPYGCSKGAADQYVLDYAQRFALKTVVLRLSGIYGPHQLASNEYGWIVQFLERIARGQSITVHGDGLQVQDMLFVEDLVDAFLLAIQHIDKLSGQAFNIGGGKEHTISPLEFIDLIDERGIKTSVYFKEWHGQEPLFYVSNLAKFQSITNWQPTISIIQGIQKLQ
jgi:CDP-paratose 2-epimerase